MQLAKAPTDGLQVVQEGLARIYHASTGISQMTIAGVFPQAMEPIPLYTIDFDDLVARKGLNSTRHIGWQYLLLNGSNVVRTAEIYPNGTQGQHRFGNLTNAFAEGTEQAIAKAEEFDEVKDPTASFELRVLRVPPLFFSTLWLKNLHRPSDLFVVIPPAPENVQPLMEYDANGILDFLWSAAQRRVASAKSPGGGPSGPQSVVGLSGPASS